MSVDGDGDDEAYAVSGMAVLLIELEGDGVEAG
jgi:hypothetical protein